MTDLEVILSIGVVILLYLWWKGRNHVCAEKKCPPEKVCPRPVVCPPAIVCPTVQPCVQRPCPPPQKETVVQYVDKYICLNDSDY